MALKLALRMALICAALSALAVAPAVAQPAPCRHSTYESASYTICTVDLRRQAIRLFWQKPDGTPYRYLSALPRTDGSPSRPLQFALNAGMYDPALKPVGLYVEGGNEHVRASTRGGYGNFHLRPNGIFFVAGDRAGVMETGAFLKARPHADIATQSGPMLVIGKRIHPRFGAHMLSAKRRIGVGVGADTHVVEFAMSDGEVTFWQIARLFRDELKTPNALFLDGGSVPAIFDAAARSGGNFLPLGPMLGVYAK